MIDGSNIGALQRAKVITTDGDRVGSVGQVYLDSRDGNPAWVTVRTGLFGTSESFVPLGGASFDGEDIRVPYAKSVVKDAPRVGENDALTPDEERALYLHYGVDFGPQENPDRTARQDAAAAAEAEEWERERRDEEREREDRRDREAADAEHGGVHAAGETRTRLRKYIVTEQQTFTIPVRHEEVRLEREVVDADDRVDAGDRDDHRPGYTADDRDRPGYDSADRDDRPGHRAPDRSDDR